VNQAVDALLDLDERAEVRQVADLSGDAAAGVYFAALPRIGSVSLSGRSARRGLTSERPLDGRRANNLEGS
jgi:hypothetical protein